MGAPVVELARLLDLPRIRGLYLQLSRRLPFVFEKSEMGRWGAVVENGKAVIGYTDNNDPEASLAHELLHIRLHERGCQRIRLGISSFDESNWLSRFIDAMNNELQHHKMLGEFIAMGFDGKQFYGESNSSAVKMLEKNLKIAKNDPKSLTLGYLIAIAPGGVITDAQASFFRREYRRISSGMFAHVCDAIDSAFQRWMASESVDLREPVRGIFQALAPGHLSWFGYSDMTGFPHDGFFVEKEFDLHDGELIPRE